jgi:predicted transcriptional regulator of viral defense system
MADLRDWASDRPLFTLEDAQRALDIERASLREKLSRLVRRGELRRIERGKYTVHDDPTIYATYLEHPSYLSLWSALRYYDLTTQQPTRVQVMAATSRADLEAIAFYRTSRMFGFGRRRYGDFEVFVADEERLLLDCLARPEVSVADLTDLLAVVDPDGAMTYAARYGQRAMKKRVGYLLERHRGVDAEALRVDDRNYPVLDLSRPDTGETDSRWRLRVNADAV